MKLRNFILALIALAVTLICTFPVVSNAATSVELKLRSRRELGYGYRVNLKDIWKIVEVTAKTPEERYTYNNTYYCIRPGQGFGTGTDIENRTYNMTTYNLKDLSTITSDTVKEQNLPADIAVVPSETTGETYTIGTGANAQTFKYTNYNALLWLLDNLYLPKATNATAQKAKLMEAAAIEDLTESPVVLTDDDIEVVQQIAIWYFTSSNESDYHVDTLPTMYVTTDDDAVQVSTSFDDTLSDKDTTNGLMRERQARVLYSYLISAAKMNAKDYVDTENVNIRKADIDPVELVDLGVQIEFIGGKGIIGPFSISEVKNMDYTLTGTLTDQANNPIAYNLLDKDKKPVAAGTTLNNMIGGANRFYLEIEDDKTITSLKFKLDSTYEGTDITLLLVGNGSNAEQPVVQIKKVNLDGTPQELPITVERKYFDLSLRKFITSRNGVATTGRVPAINTSPLSEGGDATTAIYTHSKMPLSVNVGDVVIYKIRVYNEGQLDGYVNEITDYIPTGLGFINGHNLNADNGWKIVTDPNLQTVSLGTIPNATKNLKLTDFTNITDLSTVEVVAGNAAITTDKLKYVEGSTATLLTAFEESVADLSYKEVEVACVVLNNATGQQGDLKNIAEISKAVDEYGYEIEDRDSVPGSINSTNIASYPANTNIQDDDDYEDLVIESFDLALRKFITAVGTKQVTDRKPVPVIDDVTGKITYRHPKDVVRVKNGDLVEYTIRIYNEGAQNGYASLVRDTLPEGLDFVEDNAINQQYGWTKVAGNNRAIETDYLALDNGTKNEIKAFDKATMTAPEFKDIKVVCKVNVPNNSSDILINTAEIWNDTDASGNSVEDIDSTPANNKADEDDIDTEKVQIVIFDLSLKKFISEVDGDVITDREPVVTINAQGKLNYTYKKDPVLVANNNVVIYTIRIYNEGNIDGFAEEIKDDVPEGLVFLPEHEINVAYKWKVSSDGTIRSDFLSSSSQENELSAFNPQTMQKPDYADIQVAFKVDETHLPKDRIIINTAEISKHKNDYDVDDEDSTPDNNKPAEDDIDKEYLRVKYFDLALIKYLTEIHVEEDDSEKIIETGYTGEENPKGLIQVAINKRKINSTKVTFIYKIKVTNEGEIAGYATELVDRVPDGLRFEQDDNPNWYVDEEERVLTNQLDATLLEPGESAEVEIALRWINGENNMGEKINIAEINKDDNEFGSKDIDSTPGNNVPEEDDQDYAPVILSIKTGIEQSYVWVVAVSLVILVTGIAFIKRYILN